MQLPQLALPVLAAAALLATPACQTSAKTGAVGGAAAGALAGQIIGGDTGATLLGAAVGAGAGYVIGNEKDKAKAQEERDRQAAAAAAAAPAGDPRGEVAVPQPSPLAGTRWKVTSLVADPTPEYASKLVDFGPEALVCTTTLADGTVSTVEDRYRVVGDMLVVTRTDGIINASYSLDGNLLIINCNEFRAVLEKL